ncbi:Deoxyguanosinetriphosphate triphosphohydrolase-like protein [Actinidia chinensis var. chinensis]|uniref:Deoxyguanosinetriphosphate triphosphohydrolase-like protein n=1 Tax=Actinidia chinensis var. chinensis TaxID=1590841 RepID=A0A2R6R621_ACTCC|nr:Deoxyguanosinetriphosphate triphosphohydrolase-like protein [Actinidia chinensis var. chinensis]
MVGDGRGANFPVMFSDGECEINIGSVRIHPSLEFKAFQSGLSNKIGISPNQITIYLVDLQNSNSPMEGRRQIPVTSKMNFAAVAKETDCFFLVVLKRSRRNRRPKPKQRGIDFSDYSPENEFLRSPEKLLLLRRNLPYLSNPLASGYASPRYDRISPVEFSDFNERLRNLQIRRDNYGMMMESKAISSVNLDLDSISRMDSSTISHNRLFCEECEITREKKISAPFHWCVFDAVIVGFRSSAGPIARPRKAV